MLIIKTKDIYVLLKFKFIPGVKKNLRDTEAPEIKVGGHLLPLQPGPPVYS